MDRIELILHPVRFRVVLTLGNRVLTTQQLASLLPDIAQTTLYRHINMLLDGGILEVVRETRTRGTVERELKLVKGAGRINMPAAIALPPEQQQQLFMMFIATLIADLERAQAQQLHDVPAIYTQQRLYLTFDDLQQLNQQIEGLLAAYKDPSQQTDADVRQWLFTGIVMPDAELPPLDEENDT